MTGHVCVWTYCHDSDAWDTQCGQKHQFMADGPAENDHNYCPYCGDTLRVERKPND